MEHRPSINGPSDPTLGGITQLESHSDISTLYPTAKAQWDGEIMTPEARNAKKKAEREAVIMSIRGKFLAIGLLLPLPFFVAATIIAIIFSVTNENNAELMVIPGIAGFILWLSITFATVRALFRIFYQHALKAGPFIVLMLSLLGISIQGLYLVSFPFHQVDPLKSVLAVGIGMFILSIMLSFIVLRVWVSPLLKGGAKLVLIALIAVGITLGTLAASLLV